jgi:hypothetical protein
VESDASPGMLLGAGALGQTDAARGSEPDRSSSEVLLGRPVESRLGFEPESVCMTFAQKSRPHELYKESVA